MQYGAGDVLYTQGQQPNSIYFIKEGSVNLMANITVTNKSQIPTTWKRKETFVRRQTYEILSRKVSAGDFFGEEELLLETSRRFKAVCDEKSEIFVLKKESLLELLSEKEMNEILAVHDRLPRSEEQRKELKSKLNLRNLKFRAILEATNIKPVPFGREGPDRIMHKKAVIAKSLLNKYNDDISRSLLKEECFVIK